MGFVYLVTGSRIEHVKVGMWSGTEKDLFKRYQTYYGNDMNLQLFISNDPREHELMFKKNFENYSICLELYDKKNLEEYIDYIKSLLESTEQNLQQKNEEKNELMNKIRNKILNDIKENNERVIENRNNKKKENKNNKKQNKKECSDKINKCAPIFSCKRCGYETAYKSNLLKHFKNLILCPPTISDFSISELINNIKPDEDKSIVINCNFCGTKYLHMTSLTRHKKNCDKRNLSSSQEPPPEQTIELPPEPIEPTPEPIEPPPLPPNNFGQETTIDIDATLSVPEFLKRLHFDNSYNRNVKIRSNKLKLMYVYQDDEWVTSPTNDILKKMIEGAYKFLGLQTETGNKYYETRRNVYAMMITDKEKQ
jgi:rubrerythrin